MRIEKDKFGEKEIPKTALYGISSVRAKENFPLQIPFPIEWYKAMGMVKQASYITIEEFYQQIKINREKISNDIRKIPDSTISAMIKASKEISEGKHFNEMIIPAITGGAGTSINMNINEIIANRALQIDGKEPGNYEIINPYNDANCYQSTNDTVPTALKLAIMQLLDSLQEEINRLRFKIEEKEKENFNNLRIGYTQLQEAIPTSIGRLLSTYNEALSRDWWRVSKAKERIKTVNLGGGAIGTALGIPRYFLFTVPTKLREITNQPLTRSENLSETTSNLDSFVEMHGIIKCVALNLEKMASDIRLLSSDIVGDKKIFSIPAVQVGSSIMPGKINPVIPEYMISISRKVYSNDQLITSLSASGDLELNAYLPTIGTAIIESLNLLIASCSSATDKMITGLISDTSNSWENLINSPSITTALIPKLGYISASRLAEEMKKSKTSIFDANKKIKLLTDNEINEALKPENLLSLGFSLK